MKLKSNTSGMFGSPKHLSETQDFAEYSMKTPGLINIR